MRLKPRQSGARLVHNTRRDELLRIEDTSKPLAGAVTPCGLCRRRVGKSIIHTNKVIHIYVRADGTLENESVSAGVFDRLTELNLIGSSPHQFTSLGEITNPPPITLSPDTVLAVIAPKPLGAVHAIA